MIFVQVQSTTYWREYYQNISSHYFKSQYQNYDSENQSDLKCFQQKTPPFMVSEILPSISEHLVSGILNHHAI